MPTASNSNAKKFSVWTLFTLIILALLGVGMYKEAKKANLDFSFSIFSTSTGTTSAAELPPGVVSLNLGCKGSAAQLLPNYKIKKAIFVVPYCDGNPSSAVEILNPESYFQMSDFDTRLPKENTYVMEAMWGEERAKNGIEPNRWTPWASGSAANQTETGTANLPDRIRFVNHDHNQEKIVVAMKLSG